MLYAKYESKKNRKKMFTSRIIIVVDQGEKENLYLTYQEFVQMKKEEERSGEDALPCRLQWEFTSGPLVSIFEFFPAYMTSVESSVLDFTEASQSCSLMFSLFCPEQFGHAKITKTDYGKLEFESRYGEVTNKIVVFVEDVEDKLDQFFDVLRILNVIE